MSVRAQVLIDELSYGFSTPEAQEFNEHILNKRFAIAEKMLADYMIQSDAALVVEHIHKKNTQKVSLIELDKDVAFLSEDVQYLIKIGQTIVYSALFVHSDNVGFYAHNKFVPIKDLNQIWQVVDAT